MNPNVDVVDIISVRELAPAPGASVTPDWLGQVCDPDTGTNYKMTYEDITAIISAIIGSGVIEPDRVYIGGQPGPIDPDTGDPVDVPVDGDTVNDTYLDGKVFSLELRGIGFLNKGVEWDNDVADGGWRLIGSTISDGALFTVHFHPQISPVISTPDAIGKFVSGIQLISSNTTVTAGMFRKLMVFTNGYTATLNDSYPENVLHSFTHNGPNNKQATLTAPGGQTFSWNGGTGSTLWLGKNERVGLIRSGDTWYVAYDTMGYDRVGHIVPGRLPGANQIIAQGQTLLRSDYPRLVDYITRLNATYPGSVLNAVQWASNKTYWGFGDGSTTIQVPDLRGRFPRWLDLGAGLDADRVTAGTQNKPGSPEDGAVEEHNHTTGEFNRLLRANGQGTGTSFDPGGANEPDLRTSAEMSDYGGSETRPTNAAELPLIYV